MTLEALKRQMRKRYSSEEARTLLHILFGDKPAYFTQPQVLAAAEENVRLARQIGSVTLADGRNLALFDVEVADAVLDSPNSLVVQEAGNRVFSMQTVLHEMLR